LRPREREIAWRQRRGKGVSESKKARKSAGRGGCQSKEPQGKLRARAKGTCMGPPLWHKKKASALSSGKGGTRGPKRDRRSVERPSVFCQREGLSVPKKNLTPRKGKRNTWGQKNKKKKEARRRSGKKRVAELEKKRFHAAARMEKGRKRGRGEFKKGVSLSKEGPHASVREEEGLAAGGNPWKKKIKK